MTNVSLNEDPLTAAFWRVDQACREIAAVITAPDTCIPDLQRVADVSTMAMETCEAVMRGYMKEAVDFYHFRMHARQCCTWEHPYEPLVEAYSALYARTMDAHGALTNLYLYLTGDDCVW